MKKLMQQFLSKTVHLLLYFMMGVSVLSIIMPWYGFVFDFTTWGNFGGFSVACNIVFIERFYFNYKYCWLTRKLPICMICINIFNVLCNEFYPNHYELYGQLYEIGIFSVTLFIFFVIYIEKTLKK